MQNAKITGIASYVPDYVLTNDELSHMVDTNDEWITTRVGIKERRILKGEETGSSDLGVKAVAEQWTSRTVLIVNHRRHLFCRQNNHMLIQSALYIGSSCLQSNDKPCTSGMYTILYVESVVITEENWQSKKKLLFKLLSISMYGPKAI